MDTPIEEWSLYRINKFLDAWWDISPGTYNQYHLEYEGIPEEMLNNLRFDRIGFFQVIWDKMTSKLIESREKLLEAPPRPQRRIKGLKRETELYDKD